MSCHYLLSVTDQIASNISIISIILVYHDINISSKCYYVSTVSTFPLRPAKIALFVIIPCLMPDDFTCQGGASTVGGKWLRFIQLDLKLKNEEINDLIVNCLF